MCYFFIKKQFIVPDYMKTQKHVNERMRSILIDWLVQVHEKFRLLQETLYLTVSYIDRYLAVSVLVSSHIESLASENLLTIKVIHYCFRKCLCLEVSSNWWVSLLCFWLQSLKKCMLQKLPILFTSQIRLMTNRQ